MCQYSSDLKTISLMAGQIAEALSLRDGSKISQLPTNIPHIGVVTYPKVSPSEWKMLKVNPGGEATEISPFFLAHYVNRKMFQLKVTDCMTVEQFLEEKGKFERKEAKCRSFFEDWELKIVHKIGDLRKLSDEFDRKETSFRQAVLNINNRCTGDVDRYDKIVLTILCVCNVAVSAKLSVQGAVPILMAVLAAVLSVCSVVGAFWFTCVRFKKRLQSFRECIEKYIKKD